MVKNIPEHMVHTYSIADWSMKKKIEEGIFGFFYKIQKISWKREI